MHLNQTYLTEQISGIDLKLIKLPDTANYISIENLPVTTMNLSGNVKKVAILSWRWDLVNKTSINLYISLKHAIANGFDVLLVDLISVDQNLLGTKLMESVLLFSNLYQKLPVIAAYDDPGVADWLPIMRRPWICLEAKAYRFNPFGVTYVGHFQKQGCEESFGFKHMVQRIWDSTFAQTVFYLLLGKVGMGDVRDMQFIMPAYADILAAAYLNMGRNDYLFTTAILAQNDLRCEPGRNFEGDKAYVNFRINGDQNVADIELEQYAVNLEPSGTFRYKGLVTLGEIHIATFRHSTTSLGDARYFFEPVENAVDLLKEFFKLNANIPVLELTNSTEKQKTKNDTSLNVYFID